MCKNTKNSNSEVRVCIECHQRIAEFGCLCYECGFSRPKQWPGSVQAEIITKKSILSEKGIK